MQYVKFRENSIKNLKNDKLCLKIHPFLLLGDML